MTNIRDKYKTINPNEKRKKTIMPAEAFITKQQIKNQILIKILKGR